MTNETMQKFNVTIDYDYIDGFGDMRHLVKTVKVPALSIDAAIANMIVAYSRKGLFLHSVVAA